MAITKQYTPAFSAMQFGQRLRAFRNTKHLTQQAFCLQIPPNEQGQKLSSGYLSSLENGEKSPTLNILMRIMQAFPELDIYWLLFHEHETATDTVNETPAAYLPHAQLPDSNTVRHGMKTITLQADAQLLDAAQARAQTEQTTLEAQFRQWLTHYAHSHHQVNAAMDVVSRLRNYARTGGRKFSRDEMNAR